MLQRLKTLAASIRNAFSRGASRSLDAAPTAVRSVRRALPALLAVTAVTAAGYAVVTHPPLLAGGAPGWAGAAVVVAVQIAVRNIGAAILAGVAVTWGLHAALGLGG